MNTYKLICIGVMLIVICVITMSLNIFLICSTLDDINDKLKDIKRDDKRFHVKYEQELRYLDNQFRYRL